MTDPWRTFGGPAADDRSAEPVSRYPEHRPPHPLAVTSVVSGVLGVLGLPLLGSFEQHGWWIAVPTLASLVAVVTGHLAVRHLERAERTARRLASGGIATGYLGLTLVVAETVLLVGVLGLAASVLGGTA